jgi:hypothetical protein
MIRAPLSDLVTGSSGFIGSHLVRPLRAAGHLVTGIDIRQPADPLPDGATFHLCDIRSDPFPRGRYDAVVHLAALAGVRQSVALADSYRRTNVDGTVRLLDFCQATGIPHFVFSSCSSAYGPECPLPVAQDGPADPCKPLRAHQAPGRAVGLPLRPAAQPALRRAAVLLGLGTGSAPRPGPGMLPPPDSGGQAAHHPRRRHPARAVELALRWSGFGALVSNVGTGLP